MSKENYDKIKDFLNGIGIQISIGAIPPKSFLARVYILKGSLILTDDDDLTLCNAMHEAGHIAIVPERFRHLLTGNAFNAEFCAATKEYMENHSFMDEEGRENPICRALLQNDDTAATAWSYAACIAAGVPDEIPFIMEGIYDGQAQSILGMLRARNYLGINGLAAAGMTSLGLRAKYLGLPEFPKMIRWTQQ